MSATEITIDIHAHFIPANWPDLSERFSSGPWPWLKYESETAATIMMGDKVFRHSKPSSWNANARLEQMDIHQIDHQIISALPVMFAYDKPAEHAAYACQMHNEAALEFCSAGEGRLRSLCQVPLQDIDLACAELSRAMKDGHLGVHIGNHLDAMDLDDERLVTFLNHCADENAPVLVHPWNPLGANRMKENLLFLLVGMPAEAHLSILRLILTGAFDRLSPKLNLCFAQGGGAFAYLLARAERAWRQLPAVSENTEHPPSAYLSRFYVDSLTYDMRGLRLLVDIMGEDRVMFGSDSPFELGDMASADEIKISEHIPQTARRKILSANANQFFNLEN